MLRPHARTHSMHARINAHERIYTRRANAFTHIVAYTNTRTHTPAHTHNLKNKYYTFYSRLVMLVLVASVKPLVVIN